MSISKKTAKSTSKMRSDAGAAWGFLSPWIIGFLVFSAFPLVFSFYLSLTKWNLMGDPQFVGLQNYKEMFSGNGELGQTLLATAIFTVINVAVSILFSLLLAILLNFKVRFKGLFQFFYYVPTIMPSVVMAGCLVLMFNPQLGIVNYVLKSMGVQNPPNSSPSPRYSHSRPASRCSSSPQHSRMCLRNCTKPRLSMEPARGSVSSTSPFQALLR